MTLIDKIKDRNNRFWRLYEILTAVAGWGFILSLMLIIWNSIAPILEKPAIEEEHANWLYATMGACLLLILKADFIKYKITKDPRDEPSRKWGSFDAHKFRPGEVFFIPNGYNGPREDLIVTTCPKCKVHHGFVHGEKAARICQNCQTDVPAP